jgi:hypothetical protein
MILALPVLMGVLAFGPPDEVLTPTQPQAGEPAIAPAQIDAERAGRAGPERLPTEPPAPTPVDQPEPEPSLPSWQDDAAPSEEPGEGPSESPSERPEEPTAIADWTTPVDPTYVADPIDSGDPGPRKGWGLIGAAGGMFGGMVLSQLFTGLGCTDVYCGTRGWPWRAMGLATVGLAGSGGWVVGQRLAWEQREGIRPVRSPTGRRAAGWSLFALGLAGMIADTALYQLCYDGQRGAYFEQEGFRYSCSPVISVVTLDLSTLVGATGLGLALSAEGQRRAAASFSLSPWGGRGQAGLSLSGRF